MHKKNTVILQRLTAVLLPNLTNSIHTEKSFYDKKQGKSMSEVRRWKYLLLFVVVTMLTGCNVNELKNILAFLQNNTSANTTPLDTYIVSHPTNPANSTSATFLFEATKTEASFECSLDRDSFTPCSNPMEYTGLAGGNHRFKVRTIDTAGNTDATPETYQWEVILADLTPYKPSAWDDALILRTDSDGCSADNCNASVEFNDKDTLYAYWAVKNIGDFESNDFTASVNVKNLLDATQMPITVLSDTWTWTKSLVSGQWDWQSSSASDLGQFEPGVYTIEIILNDDGVIHESDISNNKYESSFMIKNAIDPLYSDQWHLKNTGQAGNDNVSGTVDEDINVTSAWNRCSDNSCRGEGVRVVVVDDGIEIGHEDLKVNIVPGKSYDYVDNDTDPSPITVGNNQNGHGTSVAGIIAARDLNGIGVVGVAPRAELIGYNFLRNSTMDNEADAMTRDVSENHVSNNSWGSINATGRLAASSAVWRTAIDTGHHIGRNGLGTVYVFAAGNGKTRVSFLGQFFHADNSNYSGRSNYRGVVAVGAVNNRGTYTSYSERGANLLVSAFGGTKTCDEHSVVTTDRSGKNGKNSGSSSFSTSTNDDYDNDNYTRCFGRTSAATPMVSGVVALILQANPNLGWRDVHAILARSARKNDSTESDWNINGAGLHVNHNYGFGVVDADAAVLLAKIWINLETEKKFSTAEIKVNQVIADNNNTGVSSTINITEIDINEIEFIDIIFSASDHPYLGDLEITLVNVSTGTTSRLADKHRCLGSCGSSYNNWRFGSVRHLGESADGDWQLIVKDKVTYDIGTFQSWKLIFYGT